jgi:DNA-binding transcriptional MerR regulator
MGWTYKKWYQENRKQLLHDRRRRYHTDPAYRKRRIKEASESYYRRRSRDGLPADRRLIRTSSGGEFYSIGRLAEEINRSVQTIREYHSNDVIPTPLYFDSRGWRLYSDRQIVLLRDVFYRFDKQELRSLAEVASVLRREWKDGENQGGRRNRRADQRHQNGARAANH